MNTKKAIFILFLLGMIILPLISGWSFHASDPAPKIIVGNQTFKLLLANSPLEKKTGLSYKASLPLDYGMLFRFQKPDYYSFWMKDMKFPIDIIFIRDGKIVTIYKNAEPPLHGTQNLAKFSPTEPADTVLEINAGLSEKYNFCHGTKVSFSNN